MDLIYTDRQRKDIGVMKDYTFDLAFGTDENDFELTTDLENCCEADGLVYIENTEYGGIIDGLGVTTSEDMLTYKGRTWHGILESKIIQPNGGKAYFRVYGEVNNIIGDVITRCGLSELFIASSENSGLSTDGYSFDRYIGAYSGLKKLVESVNGKLKFSYVNNKVVVSASPLVDYSKDEQFDNDSVEMVVEKATNAINHLICLGKGELAERQVVHLYKDRNGNIGNTQTFFGVKELTAVYDYPNAESVDELTASGIEKFMEYATENKVQMDFAPDEDIYDVGDIVGAKEEVTETENGWKIPGGQTYAGPRMRFTEGDWSNAAFWLVAGAIRGSIGCQGLDMESPQGDRAIVSLLEEFGAETKTVLNQITVTHKEMKGICIDASQIPDLVPILCIAGAAAEGKTEITNAGRLRIKESDRLAAMADCLKKIGVEVEEREDGLLITGGCNPPEGEIIIDSHGDHRIVMAMAIAAVSLGVDITIEHAEAVNKSYPSFFAELKKLGGVADVL